MNKSSKDPTLAEFKYNNILSAILNTSAQLKRVRKKIILQFGTKDDDDEYIMTVENLNRYLHCYHVMHNKPYDLGYEIQPLE